MKKNVSTIRGTSGVLMLALLATLSAPTAAHAFDPAFSRTGERELLVGRDDERRELLVGRGDEGRELRRDQRDDRRERAEARRDRHDDDAGYGTGYERRHQKSRDDDARRRER
jgi:hypothetical protein